MKRRFLAIIMTAALSACGSGPGGGGQGPVAPGAPSMSVNPSSLSLVQAGQSLSLTVTEMNEAVGVTLDPSSCTQFITLNTTSSSSPKSVFTVTAVAPGTCSLGVSDANGNHVSVPVVVTTTSGTLQ